MIHYHGLPITPSPVLYALAGRSFCVSYAEPSQVILAHGIGQSVMLDNGAFTAWKQRRAMDWTQYADWCRPWLRHPTTWAVIPDVIDGTEEENDLLLAKWFQSRVPRGAPVWHLHESFERFRRLCHGYERVCVGSSGEYASVGTDAWHRRMTEAFDYLSRGNGPPETWLHMLRGMSLAGSQYPFASCDSCAVALNFWRSPDRPLTIGEKILNARRMAERWDRKQCPAWA